MSTNPVDPMKSPPRILKEVVVSFSLPLSILLNKRILFQKRIKKDSRELPPNKPDFHHLQTYGNFCEANYYATPCQ